MIEFLWNLFSAIGHNAEWLVLLASASLKGTIVLAAATVISFALRGPAMRHLMWCVALCGLLALPLLSSRLHVWQVPVPSDAFPPAPTTSWQAEAHGVDAALSVNGQSQHDHIEPLILNETLPNASMTLVTRDAPDALPTHMNVTAPHRLPTASHRTTLHWTTWLLAGWLMGVLVISSRLLIGIIGARWIACQATPFRDEAWTALVRDLSGELGMRRRVRLLRSQRAAMPMTWGWLRPVVLLPYDAIRWSAERRRMVLLHELAHVKRYDYATQILAQIVCALYWFNPLVWYAARRLRIERERACDDHVLAVGIKASEYAHYLLNAARSLHSAGSAEWSQAATIAIARRSQLEGRLLAILDPRPKQRLRISRGVAVAIVMSVGILTLSLAAVQPATRAMHGQRDQSTGLAAHSFGGDEQPLRSPTAATVEASASYIETPEGAANVNQGAKEKSAPSKSIEEADQESEQPGEPSDTSTKSAKRRIDDRQEPNAPEPLIHPVVTPVVSVIPKIAEDIGPSIIERIVPVIVERAVSQVDLKLRFNPRVDVNLHPAQESKRDGKSVDYIDELAGAGYTNLSVDQLIKLKTHGVTGAYVKSLRVLGYSNLSVDEIAKLRVHGVSSAYIEGMRAAGYTSLSTNDLARLRIHNVTPEYVKGLKAAGFANLSVREIADLGIHRVTPEFINGMRAAGFNNLSTKQLKQLRMHNVTPEFIRAVRNRGFGDLSLDQIIKLKIFNILDAPTNK